MYISNGRYSVLYRAIALVLVCLFFVNDISWALDSSVIARPSRSSSLRGAEGDEAISKLAAQSVMPDREFREKVMFAQFRISVEAMMRHLNLQLEKEKGIFKDKWKEHRTQVVEDIYDPSISGRIKDKVDGLKSVAFVRSAGFMAATGQMGWADLDCELETSKEFGGMPVVYIDSMLCNTPDKCVQKHEVDEILQREYFRTNVLHLSIGEMADWIKNHINSSDEKLNKTEYKGMNSRQIAKLFCSRSYPLQDLYEKLKLSKDFDYHQEVFDFNYIWHLVHMAHRQKQPGTDEESARVNIAAAPRNKKPSVSSQLSYIISPDADWTKAFSDNSRPLGVEVGFGSGEGLLGLAKANPNRNYIGIETKAVYVDDLNDVLSERGVTNIRLIHAADFNVLPRQPKNSVSEFIYVMVRMVDCTVLHGPETIKMLLKPGGRICISSDARGEVLRERFLKAGFKQVSAEFPHESESYGSNEDVRYIFEKPARGTGSAAGTSSVELRPPEKPKGSCADCLNSIIDNDTLLEKAMSKEGFDIEKDLKPARLKLKNPDQPFSDTTIYDREIKPLMDLGILIRLSDGRLKFSDMMMRPNTTGPPDKQCAIGLVRQITEIEYRVGEKGPAQDKPFHRGEIPPSDRPQIARLVMEVALRYQAAQSITGPAAAPKDALPENKGMTRRQILVGGILGILLSGGIVSYVVKSIMDQNKELAAQEEEIRKEYEKIPLYPPEQAMLPLDERINNLNAEGLAKRSLFLFGQDDYYKKIFLTGQKSNEDKSNIGDFISRYNHFELINIIEDALKDKIDKKDYDNKAVAEALEKKKRQILTSDYAKSIQYKMQRLETKEEKLAIFLSCIPNLNQARKYAELTHDDFVELLKIHGLSWLLEDFPQINSLPELLDSINRVYFYSKENFAKVRDKIDEFNEKLFIPNGFYASGRLIEYFIRKRLPHWFFRIRYHFTMEGKDIYVVQRIRDDGIRTNLEGIADKSKNMNNIGVCFYEELLDCAKDHFHATHGQKKPFRDRGIDDGFKRYVTLLFIKAEEESPELKEFEILLSNYILDIALHEAAHVVGGDNKELVPYLTSLSYSQPHIAASVPLYRMYSGDHDWIYDEIMAPITGMEKDRPRGPFGWGALRYESMKKFRRMSAQEIQAKAKELLRRKAPALYGIFESESGKRFIEGLLEAIIRQEHSFPQETQQSAGALLMPKVCEISFIPLFGTQDGGSDRLADPATPAVPQPPTADLSAKQNDHPIDDGVSRDIGQCQTKVKSPALLSSTQLAQSSQSSLSFLAGHTKIAITSEDSIAATNATFQANPALTKASEINNAMTRAWNKLIPARDTNPRRLSDQNVLLTTNQSVPHDGGGVKKDAQHPAPPTPAVGPAAETPHFPFYMALDPLLGIKLVKWIIKDILNYLGGLFNERVYEGGGREGSKAPPQLSRISVLPTHRAGSPFQSPLFLSGQTAIPVIIVTIIATTITILIAMPNLIKSAATSVASNILPQSSSVWDTALSLPSGKIFTLITSIAALAILVKFDLADSRKNENGDSDRLADSATPAEPQPPDFAINGKQPNASSGRPAAGDDETAPANSPPAPTPEKDEFEEFVGRVRTAASINIPPQFILAIDENNIGLYGGLAALEAIKRSTPVAAAREIIERVMAAYQKLNPGKAGTREDYPQVIQRMSVSDVGSVSMLDATSEQQDIVRSQKPLEFTPGLLYHGRDGLDEIVLSDVISGDIPLGRLAYYEALNCFDSSSKSPAIFVFSADFFNRSAYEDKAKLEIFDDRNLGVIDPFPTITSPVSLDDVVEIWVSEDTYVRYQDIVKSPLLDVEKALKPKIEKLLCSGKLKVIPGLNHSMQGLVKNRDINRNAVGRYAIRRDLLAQIPKFKIAAEDAGEGKPAPKEPPALSGLKRLLLLDMNNKDYCLKVAPWLEESAFFLLPMMTGLYLFGLESIWAFIGTALVRITFFFLHERATWREYKHRLITSGSGAGLAALPYLFPALAAYPAVLAFIAVATFVIIGIHFTSNYIYFASDNKNRNSGGSSALTPPAGPATEPQELSPEIYEAVNRIRISGNVDRREDVKPALEEILKRFINPATEDGKKILSDMKYLRIDARQDYLKRRTRSLLGAGIALNGLAVSLVSIMAAYKLFEPIGIPILIGISAVLLFIVGLPISIDGLRYWKLKRKPAAGSFMNRSETGLYDHILLERGWNKPILPHEFGHFMASMLNLKDESDVMGEAFACLVYGEKGAFDDLERLSYNAALYLGKALRGTPLSSKASDMALQYIYREVQKPITVFTFIGGDESSDRRGGAYIAGMARGLFGDDDRRALEFIIPLFRKDESKPGNAFQVKAEDALKSPHSPAVGPQVLPDSSKGGYFSRYLSPAIRKNKNRVKKLANIFWEIGMGLKTFFWPGINYKIEDITIRLHGLALNEGTLIQIAGCVKTLYSDLGFRGVRNNCFSLSDELGAIMQDKFPEGDVYSLSGEEIYIKRPDLHYPVGWSSVMDYIRHSVTYIRLGDYHIVVDANAQDYTSENLHPVDVEIFVKSSFKELADALCLHYGGVAWNLTEGLSALKEAKRAKKKHVTKGVIPTAPKKPKGSCTDCLNSIIDNDALLEKALSKEGFDIETDLKPARLKLKNPDQSFSDTTIYDREIAPLINLGILIPPSNGRLRFSDMMMRPNTTGPPDKQYTIGLIHQITEINYPIGVKGPAKDRPLHRGEIPKEVLSEIRKRIEAIAQRYRVSRHTGALQDKHEEGASLENEPESKMQFNERMINSSAIRKCKTLRGILKTWRHVHPGTCYVISSLPKVSDMERLWRNMDGVEFVLFPICTSKGTRFVVIRGDKFFTPLISIPDYLFSSSAVSFIHNHRDIQPFPSLSSGGRWKYLGGDWSILKEHPTMREGYVYTRAFGYVKFSIDKKKFDPRMGSDKTKVRVWKGGRVKTFTSSAAFPQDMSEGWFEKNIRDGAQKIRLEMPYGRIVEWEKSTTLDNILQKMIEMDSGNNRPGNRGSDHFPKPRPPVTPVAGSKARFEMSAPAIDGQAFTGRPDFSRRPFASDAADLGLRPASAEWDGISPAKGGKAANVLIKDAPIETIISRIESAIDQDAYLKACIRGSVFMGGLETGSADFLLAIENIMEEAAISIKADPKFKNRRLSDLFDIEISHAINGVITEKSKRVPTPEPESDQAIVNLSVMVNARVFTPEVTDIICKALKGDAENIAKLSGIVSKGDLGAGALSAIYRALPLLRKMAREKVGAQNIVRATVAQARAPAPAAEAEQQKPSPEMKRYEGKTPAQVVREEAQQLKGKLAPFFDEAEQILKGLSAEEKLSEGTREKLQMLDDLAVKANKDMMDPLYKHFEIEADNARLAGRRKLQLFIEATSMPFSHYMRNGTGSILSDIWASVDEQNFKEEKRKRIMDRFLLLRKILEAMCSMQEVRVKYSHEDPSYLSDGIYLPGIDDISKFPVVIKDLSESPQAWELQAKDATPPAVADAGAAESPQPPDFAINGKQPDASSGRPAAGPATIDFPREPVIDASEASGSKLLKHAKYIGNLLLMIQRLGDIEIHAIYKKEIAKAAWDVWAGHRIGNDLQIIYWSLRGRKNKIDRETSVKLRLYMEDIRLHMMMLAEMADLDPKQYTAGVTSKGTEEDPVSRLLLPHFFAKALFVESANAESNMRVFKEAVARMKTGFVKMSEIYNEMSGFTAAPAADKSATPAALGVEMTAQNAPEIDTTVKILKQLMKDDKEGAGKYYTVRYNETKIGRDSSAERLLRFYVEKVLLMYMHGEGRVELKPSGANDKGLVSVRCYKDRSRSDSALIGESHIDISEDTSGKALRIIGMLNMAFLASHIPNNFSSLPSDEKSKYDTLLSDIRAQCVALADNEEPFEKALKDTSNGIWIILPRAEQIPIGDREEYYALAEEQLNQAA